MKYILPVLFALLLTSICFAQVKQDVVIPPSKDTVIVTITTYPAKTDYVIIERSTAPGNKPPIASAGNDVSVTLPANTVTLSAISSTDADGSISTYKWSQVSGNPANLTQVNTAANVSGLTQGVYVFRVTVTDNGGLSDNDEVQVTVNPAAGEPPSTGYILSVSEPFDKLSDLSPNQIGVTSETAPLDKYFSTAITFNSPGCFKSIVPAGGNNQNSGNRSEQQFNGTNNNPKPTHNPIEGAVEYDAYYENWSTVRGHSGHTWQWHPYTQGGSAIVSLQNYGGKFNVVLSGALTSNGANKSIQTISLDVPSNKWVHHKWEFKWSSGSDGYVRLYIDGVQIVNFKGKTADGSGQYVKCGQNKWGSMSVPSVVYYDNLKIYRK